MKYKIHSWKQKVDPAFDKIIKQYIQILNHTGLPDPITPFLTPFCTFRSFQKSVNYKWKSTGGIVDIIIRRQNLVTETISYNS